MDDIQQRAGTILHVQPTTDSPYVESGALKEGAYVPCAYTSIRSFIQFTNVGEAAWDALRAMDPGAKIFLIAASALEGDRIWEVRMEGSDLQVELSSFRYLHFGGFPKEFAQSVKLTGPSDRLCDFVLRFSARFSEPPWFGLNCERLARVKRIDPGSVIKSWKTTLLAAVAWRKRTGGKPDVMENVEMAIATGDFKKAIDRLRGDRLAPPSDADVLPVLEPVKGDGDQSAGSLKEEVLHLEDIQTELEVAGLDVTGISEDLSRAERALIKSDRDALMDHLEKARQKIEHILEGVEPHMELAEGELCTISRGGWQEASFRVRNTGSGSAHNLKMHLGGPVQQKKDIKISQLRPGQSIKVKATLRAIETGWLNSPLSMEYERVPGEKRNRALVNVPTVVGDPQEGVEITSRANVEKGALWLDVKIENGSTKMMDNLRFRLHLQPSALTLEQINPPMAFREGQLNLGGILPGEGLEFRLQFVPRSPSGIVILGCITYDHGPGVMGCNILRAGPFNLKYDGLKKVEGLTREQLHMKLKSRLSSIMVSRAFQVPVAMTPEDSFKMALECAREFGAKETARMKDPEKGIMESWLSAMKDGNLVAMQVRMQTDLGTVEFAVAAHQKTLQAGLLAAWEERWREKKRKVGILEMDRPTLNPMLLSRVRSTPSFLFSMCSGCNGTGKCKTCKATGRCPRCGGEGRMKLMDKPCEFCEATGHCPDCSGRGICHVCGGLGWA